MQAEIGSSLARHWPMIAARGVLAILFGVLALAWPGLTIASIALLFGVYMLADGAVAFASGLRAASHHRSWVPLMLEGIVDLLAGIVALTWPGMTVLVFVMFLGVWSVISGAAMIAAALRVHAAHGRWLLALSGAVSALWGMLLFAVPVAGAVVLAWWLGLYALVFGVVLLTFANRLRGQHGRFPAAA